MSFLYTKAVHIIFVVTWFSGMFYLGRLFVYNAEANDKIEEERKILQTQLNTMARRLLYAITLPSAALATISGLSLFSMYDYFPMWLKIKVGMVFLLLLYNASLCFIYTRQSKGSFAYSGAQLRIWNEAPTVFLVAIVMLAVVKENISLAYGLSGLAALMVLLFSAIKIYKNIRKIKR